MKLSITLLLFFFTVNVIAGGIRGAYERMYVWYAYRAEIEWLYKKDGNLHDLQICGKVYGSMPDGTLTFNEFIEIANRKKEQIPRQPPNIYNKDLMPKVDAIAGRIWNNFRGWVVRWPYTENIWSESSYTDMLKRVAGRLQETKTGPNALPANNPNVLNAIDAIQKVVISRKIDYEKYRMPAMKAAFPNVKFETWDIALQAEPNAEEFDLKLTLDANPDIPDLGKQIDYWVQKYHTDSSPVEGDPRTAGEIRRAHRNAIKMAEVAESRVVNNNACT